MVYIRVIDLFLVFLVPHEIFTLWNRHFIGYYPTIKNFAIRGVSILAVYIYNPCQEHALKARAMAPIGVAGFL